jgi:hypothetical protein
MALTITIQASVALHCILFRFITTERNGLRFHNRQPPRKTSERTISVLVKETESLLELGDLFFRELISPEITKMLRSER